MEIKIYTDGGCSGNPGPGGWAYVITVAARKGSSKVDTYEESGAELYTTNNRMEVSAVIEALKKLPAIGDKGMDVSVFTDSQYVQRGMTEWIQRWKANGWRNADKEPVKNVELWQELDNIAALYNIDWRWVKGHNGDPLNERCDSLVQTAMERLLYKTPKKKKSKE
jgi:ribonuclease HI